MAQHDDHAYVVIEEKGSGDFGAFMMGLALGAGIALLLAPKSGVELRRDIQDRARRVRDAAEDAAHDLADTVADSFDQAKSEVEDRIDTARAQVEMRKDQVSQAIDAGRVAAKQARADLERRIAQTKASYQAEGETGSGSRTEQ